MREALQKVESHAKQCHYSNQPGGQGDCPTCKKWRKMVQLREHYKCVLRCVAVGHRMHTLELPA